MPGKHTIKKYLAEGIYHIYNRGNRKKEIFVVPDDYMLFEHMLECYLSSYTPKTSSRRNFHGRIRLFAYCLMPNHFHLLVKQACTTDIAKFMQSITTSYSMIFNRKYNLVGRLFQGPYKGRLVESVEDFVQVFNYIHENPKEIWKAYGLYPYSSQRAYLRNEKITFITKPNDEGINLTTG